MKVRIDYSIEATDYLRRAIRNHYGLEGLATREEIKDWFRLHGEAETDTILYDLDRTAQS
jgi:hypothetical protein